MAVLELALDNTTEDLVSDWTNADNKDYAEKLSLKDFVHFLRVSGLSDDPDVALITEYILKSQSILEVGGGFGRVINAIRQLGYNRNLTTIEYARPYAEYLKSNIDDCDVIEADYLTYKFKERFDLVLMMWTTISVFSPKEQKDCLLKCANILKHNGSAVIDLLITNHSEEAKSTNSKEYCLRDKRTGANRYAYMPSTFEIIRAAAMAGLAVRQVREYVAGSAARCLVILGKS